MPYPLDNPRVILESPYAGIDAGHAWFRAAGAIAVCTDLGISSGMRLAIDRAAMLDTHVHYRSLGDGVLELLHIENPNAFAPFPAQPDTNQEK